MLGGSSVAIPTKIDSRSIRMVAVYMYPPNYAASALQGILKAPIQASAGIPAGKTLVDNVNGMMNGVFAYGGATMFNELMAEMRRPWDFWKAILISNIFISSVYMIFGLVCYSRQGQFTYNPTFQGTANLWRIWKMCYSTAH